MKALKKGLTITVIAFAVIISLFIAGIAILTVSSMLQSKRPVGGRTPQTSGTFEIPELDFAVEDSEEPLEIDTYILNQLASKRYLYIYDAEYLGLFFEQDSVTPEETKQAVRENGNITPRFKELLYSYIDAIAEKYPEADLRVLHYNLKTIEVVECTESELMLKALSADAYGCYRKDENKIYVNRDYQYEPGTWEYQVILHEFGHAARSIQQEDENGTVRVQLSKTYYEIPEEALNSLFTVSLLDYEERDIAYQLQSNMFLVMLECLDDYSLSDYINHSLSYLAHKLDVQNGDNNYAMAIFQLIGEQRKDYKDDRYEREQQTYYPIYDYICRMYLDRYATDQMRDEDITALIDTLIEKVTYDVPEDYRIDTEEFYRFASEYIGGAPDTETAEK